MTSSEVVLHDGRWDISVCGINKCEQTLKLCVDVNSDKDKRESLSEAVCFG